MITNKRVDWVDVAKGIGMICVILAHVEEQYLKCRFIHFTCHYSFSCPAIYFLSNPHLRNF